MLLQTFFLECIQTRKEIVELMDAFDFGGLAIMSSFSGQQQLANKIKNSLFAPNSVFEFVCMNCKSSGNRFITATETQKEYTSKINELSGELDNTKKLLNDVSNTLSKETMNSNDLATKLSQAKTLIQQANDTVHTNGIGNCTAKNSKR